EAGDHGFLPARIGGKLFMSALSNYYIPAGSALPIPLAQRVSFVQVLNIAGLKPRSRKPDQYRNIERDINDRILPVGSITDYHLLLGNADAFRSGDPSKSARWSAAAPYSPSASGPSVPSVVTAM